LQWRFHPAEAPSFLRLFLVHLLKNWLVLHVFLHVVFQISPFLLQPSRSEPLPGSFSALLRSWEDFEALKFMWSSWHLVLAWVHDDRNQDLRTVSEIGCFGTAASAVFSVVFLREKVDQLLGDYGALDSLH
jgi:hypothetical protein